MIENIHACENNPENAFTTKLSKQTTCGYLILYSIHLMAKNKINVTTKKKKIPWKVLLRLKTACNKNNCRWKKEMLPPTEEEYES